MNKRHHYVINGFEVNLNGDALTANLAIEHIDGKGKLKIKNHAILLVRGEVTLSNLGGKLVEDYPGLEVEYGGTLTVKE